jgi:hypothetical protein
MFAVGVKPFFLPAWCLGAGLLLASTAPAQQAEPGGAPPKATGVPPAAKPSIPNLKVQLSTPLSLEAMLDMALKSNPDVRLAEAKLREAEAELNRVRLQISQKVSQVQQALELHRAMIKEAQTIVDTLRQEVAAGRSHGNQLATAQMDLYARKAGLSKLEAELPTLLGVARGKLSFDSKTGQIRLEGVPGNKVSLDFGFLDLDSRESDLVVHLNEVLKLEDLKLTRVVRGARAQPGQPVGSVTEMLRKALDTPISVEFKQVPLVDVLKDLQAKVPHFRYQSMFELGPKVHPITFKLEGVPLAAVLQAVEDLCVIPPGEPAPGGGGPVGDSLGFFVRDYGIILAPSNNMPRGATSVVDFWKSKPREPRPGGAH